MISYLRLLALSITCICSPCSGASAPTVGPQVSGRWVSQNGSQTLIVFVHGLTGGSDTWRRETGPEWPQILAKDPLFSGADVYVAEYHSALWGTGPTPPAIASALAAKLRATNVNASKYQSIVFVAHSLGGIIAREAILRDAVLQRNVKALYLFAVPSEGSSIANLGALLPSSKIVASLKETRAYGSYLDGVSKRWINSGLTSVRSYCAYETRALKIGPLKTIVVTPRSAAELCTTGLRSIEADHVDIVKPSGPNDIRHQWLRNWYKDTFPNAALAAQAEADSPVLLATCRVDRYGREFQAAIATEAEASRISLRLSDELPSKWEPRAKRFLWEKYQPRVIVIHLSCFQEGGESNTQASLVDRDIDFLNMLKTLEPYRTKVLVYSRAFASVPKHLDDTSIMKRFKATRRLEKFAISATRAFADDPKQRAAFRIKLSTMLKE